jgi:lipid II:glycine glycyltransferase (peptidoglycan interpeptide bridge formation enzyme)
MPTLIPSSNRKIEEATPRASCATVEHHTFEPGGETKDRSIHQLSPIEDARWNEFLLRSSEASLFHSSQWLNALRQTYGYKPVVYTTAKPEEKLQNGLVLCEVESPLTGRRLVSVPFSDYCQPLADSHEDLCLLFKSVEEQVSHSGWRYFEVRPLTPTGIARPNWQTSAVYLHHQIDLEPDIDAIYRNLHRDSVQRKIRRAERDGLKYAIGTAEPLLDAFFQIMVQTRRRHGVPPQPKKWFRSLVESFGESLQIRVAFHGSEPVAAMMTIRHKDTLVYKYGGSDVRYNKMGGMHLLYWNSIQDAKRWGLRTFDLGRTDAHQSGLATFKKRWGATESSLSYSRYSEAGSGFHSFELAAPNWKMRTANYVFAHTPDALLPILGNLLYRHFG